MLESIYRVSGLRVGLFTSPHLVAFGERIQVNRQVISERDVVRLVLDLQPWLREFSPQQHPTFFEVTTVMALQYFAAQHCDLVIWETGLGGRLDATNIVTPLASVITNIQYDHQQWLGETLARIASEKAGIIKRGVPVITSALETEALRVIEETALEKKAPLLCVGAAETRLPPLDTIELPLLGAHQRLNAALAIAIVRALAGTFPVNEQVVRSGLCQVHWPGRLQLVTRPSGKKILLDGAHNLAGAETLAVVLKENFASTRPVFILGILQDKDWKGVCHLLAPLATKILVVRVSSERAADPSQLQQMCQQVNPSAETTISNSVADALESTADESLVVVAGSLYLVGEALENLEGVPTRAVAERALNEWSAKT